MKNVLPMSCVMLAFAATTALAGGLDFVWGPECAADAMLINKNFARNSNTGSSTMVASSVPTVSHERLIAVDAVVGGQIAFYACGPVIPDWWQFKNAGACRIATLSTNATISGNAVNCLDAWSGQGTPTIDYYGDPVLVGIPVPPVQGRRARVKVGCWAPVETASAVEGGLEYFVFNVVVDHTKTVGTGSCAGCQVPMCWALNNMMPGYEDGGVDNAETIMTPILNNEITWQGGPGCSGDAAQNKT
jgi:hypothetical protein